MTRYFLIVSAMIFFLINPKNILAMSIPENATVAIQNVTPNAPNHVHTKKIKIRRRLSLILPVLPKIPNPDTVYVEEPLAQNRNRIELVKEEELSDYVKFRLWLARQLAMKKFEQVWQS